MYVAELEDRVSIVDLEGNVIGRFGSERSHDAGKLLGPARHLDGLGGLDLRGRGAGRAPPAEVRAARSRTPHPTFSIFDGEGAQPFG